MEESGDKLLSTVFPVQENTQGCLLKMVAAHRGFSMRIKFVPFSLDLLFSTFQPEGDGGDLLEHLS